MGKVVNKRELAEILGISERTLSDWQTEPAFPIVELAEVRGEENAYDTALVIAWWLLREISRTSETDKARRRLLTAQAEHKELELARARGQLVAADDVRRAAYETAHDVRNAMMTIPDHVAPILAAERDPIVIHRKLSEEIKRALTALSEHLRRTADDPKPEAILEGGENV